MRARVADDRVIQEIRSDRVDLAMLVGARGGGHLRRILDAHIHAERIQGTPLYLLLDDISGASLVSAAARSRWSDDWTESASGQDLRQARFAAMENICTGFATGSSALRMENRLIDMTPVPELLNPDDPAGWHELECLDQAAAFRRARLIDVSVEQGQILIDAGFQDSTTDPQMVRVAIHEYRVSAKASMEDGVLTEIEAVPCILPFPECPAAVANVQRLIGTPLADFRTRVIDLLPGPMGCTHLNDVMRSLAEVPVLADMLVMEVLPK